MINLADSSGAMMKTSSLELIDERAQEGCRLPLIPLTVHQPGHCAPGIHATESASNAGAPSNASGDSERTFRGLLTSAPKAS